MPLLRQCNTAGRVSHCSLPQQKKNFPTYTRCSENQNKTCADENRKIRDLKFDNP